MLRISLYCLLVLLPAISVAQTSKTGLGASTLTCVDKDGDGYGTGSGCTGPDADDYDVAVHTAAQAVTKYGNIQAFLKHRGYTWITQYWVISTTGSDTTCGTTAHTFSVSPDPTAVQACATFAHISASIATGDVVFWRSGTYTEEVTVPTGVGTASAWNIYMAYPGETVTMGPSAESFNISPGAYLYLDGFKIVGNGNQTPISGGTCFWNGVSCYGDGSTHTDSTLTNHDVNVRNVEVSGGYWNISWFNAYNMILEDSSLHDSTTEHNLYIGANVSLSHDYYVRRNLIYNSSTTGMQINGRVSNAIVEQNYIYDNYNSGISFEEGVNHSYVRNNLDFSNGQTSLIIYDYDGNCNQSGFGTTSGLGGICPYDQSFNTIEGNTFWIGNKRAFDASTFANYGFQASNGSTVNTTADLGHNIFRNNIIIGTGGSGFDPAVQFDQQSNIATSTFDSNILWSSDGSGTSSQFGVGGTRYTCATVGPSTGATVVGTCVTADPKFVAASTTYYNTPASFNLQLQSTSPAKAAGSLTTTGKYDARSVLRAVPTSIGAYEYITSGISIPLQSWTTFLTHGAPAQDAGYSKMVYAGNGTACGVHIYHHIWTEYDSAIMCWNYDANYWTLENDGGNFSEDGTHDAGHSIGDIDWVQSTNTLQMLCCYSGSNEPENQANMYRFDIGGQSEQSLFTRPVPYTNTLEFSNAMTYDPVNGVYVMISDQNNAVEYYNPATNVWSTPTVTGSGPVSSNAMHSLAYDSHDGRIYFFGGGSGNLLCPGDGGNETPYNTIFAFQVTGPSSGTWSAITPSGTPPAPRFRAAMAYSTQDNIFVVEGGISCTGTNNTGVTNTDTYVYDPTANAWSQISISNPPAVSSGMGGAYDRMMYDPDHNAFIYFPQGPGGTNQSADGNWTTYSVATNVLCYTACSNVGVISDNPQPSAGAINRYTTGNTISAGSGISWARYPSLAVSGSTLYIADLETDGTFFDPTLSYGMLNRSYAEYTATGSSLTNMGADYTAITPDDCSGYGTGDQLEDDTKIAVVNGVPWITYWKVCTGAAGGTPSWPTHDNYNAVYAKSWTGSSWSANGASGNGRIPLVNNVPLVTQNRPTIFAEGTTPYIVLRETDKTVPSQQHSTCYVFSWNGSAWNNVGGSYVANSFGTHTSCDATSDGTNVWAVTTEFAGSSYTIGDVVTTVGQVYVWKNVAGTWSQIGGSLNQNTGNWASEATILWIGGQPYVAWLERSGASTSQIFVKTWNGTAWVLVGSGTLNRNTSTGWAWAPHLTTDGTNLYCGWAEQSAIGQKPQAYVSEWNGTSWTQLGGSLNMDSTNGSSQHVAIAYWNAHPVASWGEVLPGSMRQIYAKQWSGTSWVPLSTSLQLWHHGHLGHFTISGSGSRQ